MRAPQLVSDFLAWRWAPCVGLTAGSLAFVALALLLIPTSFGGEPHVGRTLGSFDDLRSQKAIFSSSLTRSAIEPQERPESQLRVPRSLPVATPPINQAGAPLQRGFSPIIERAETLPPAAAAPPAEPSVPAPGTVVVVQPEPGGQSREVPTQ